MVISRTYFDLKKLKNLADWKLLLFLVLFLDVKLEIKTIAVVGAYLLQFNFKFGFSLKNSRLPLFYLAAIGISLINWVFSNNVGDFNYILVLLTGIGFWMLCILAMHQIKLSVENNDAETINNTIVIFFLLNAVMSLINLATIIAETGYLNPYNYQGQHQKYFIGTGDYIRGLSFDTSTTNAVLNAFGVVYFLKKKNAAMLIVCMAVMLFTGSNFIDIVLLLILAGLFLFKTDRVQKSLVVVCVMFGIVFMTRISMQNYIYVHETIKNTFFPQPIHPTALVKVKPYITLRPDSELTADERKEKVARGWLDSVYMVANPKYDPFKSDWPLKTATGRIFMPNVNIQSKPYQHIKDTTAYQRQLLGFIGTHKANLPMSGKDNYKTETHGKAIGLMQTLHFFQHYPLKILTGDGVGNFSSKLAFRAGGFNFAGGYPRQFTYVSPDFLSNHLDIYLDFFSKKSDYHSLTNNPGSVYDQLLAEYGLLGVAAFVLWYLGYFLKHYRKLTYGLPILVLLLSVFAIDYWFEQLSILLFFELLMLLNIKENSAKTSPAYAN